MDIKIELGRKHILHALFAAHLLMQCFRERGLVARVCPRNEKVTLTRNPVSSSSASRRARITG